MGVSDKPDFPANDMKPEQRQALNAQAFCMEVNALLAALRGFVAKEKVPQPVACAAMLIFCRNSVDEGHAARKSLDTVLRKNFPFMKLETPKGEPQ